MLFRSPEVLPELSSGRLLTMTWLEGRPLLDFIADAGDIERRNQVAMNMFRAWYVPFYGCAVIHGDPHLGNYTICDDGTVNLLDFGCIRVFPPSFVKGVIDLYMALRDGDRYFYTGDAELMDNPAIAGVIDLTSISLSEIILQNTSIPNLPRDVFVVGRGGIRSVFDGVNSVFDHLDDFFDNFPWESPAGGNGGLHIFHVPEPSTCLLAMLGGVVCLSRRRLT